jgi:hypothetical protein
VVVEIFPRLRQKPPMARSPRGRFVSESSVLRYCRPFWQVCLCSENHFSWETETDLTETGSKVSRGGVCYALSAGSNDGLPEVTWSEF